jgi:hypothetical protein
MKKRKGVSKIINRNVFDLSKLRVSSQLRNLAFAVFFFVFTWILITFSNIAKEFIEIFNADITLGILVILLFIEICIAFWYYLYNAFFFQIDRIDKYLELEKLRKPSFRTAIIGISILVLIILMITSVNNIGNFCVYAILYSCLNYIESFFYHSFVCSRLILKFKNKVKEKSTASNGYIKSVSYYLQKPHLLRITLAIISLFSALSILLYFKSFENQINIEYAVYAIVIITIAINELVLYFWRRK